ncbi:MAG: winged helix-turn-helix domain-containing protein [Candidatus Eisenbacteria bacterium]
MLEPIIGSKNRERVLLFLFARGEGYAREIAGFFGVDLYGIQTQLDRLETGGVVSGRQAGRTRLYTFRPTYPFLKELRALLEKTTAFLKEDEREALLMNRRRPRGKGKPL